MPLSKAQEKAFQKWLGDHHVSRTCPACGSEAGWTAYNEILSTMILDLEQKKISPSTNGFLVLTCNNCRHILFFAAPPILQG